VLRCQVLHAANGTQANVAKREEVNGAHASQIRWRRIVNVNVTIEIRSLVSDAPQIFTVAMAARRAAFSGNTSLIAHFLVYLYFSLQNYNSRCRKTKGKNFCSRLASED